MVKTPIVIPSQERLVTAMGRALNSLSVVEEEKKNRTYATWDAVVDRYIPKYSVRTVKFYRCLALSSKQINYYHGAFRYIRVVHL